MQGRGQSVALSQTQSTVRISYCVRSEINVWGVATTPMFGALWQRCCDIRPHVSDHVTWNCLSLASFKYDVILIIVLLL